MPPGEVIELRPMQAVRFQDKATGDTEFTQNPDGSEIISLFGPDEDTPLSRMAGEAANQDRGFGENLAELMSSSQRSYLADKLIQYHEVDLSSRESWDQLTKQALRVLGIEKIDTTNLPFPGAASIQHPLIAEACVQFNANAIQEFFPATGPVKGDLAGEATEDSEAQVERATKFMNFYLTNEDEGYYGDCDQSLFYLPIAGSLFKKAWLDPRTRMPRVRYVKAEDFVAPYYARDLENCNRYCHQYQMSGSEIRRAIHNGEFLDLDLPRPPLEADDSERTRLEDKSDRRTRVLHEDDELYDVLEYHVEMALATGIDEFDDGTVDLPYIIIVDKTSREILSVRRNWKQQDRQRKKRIWFAHYKFLPGLGFYGWGFLHVIGSLADAVSGTVRALLDSALMATLQGGFRAKDGVKKAGSIAIEPGRWKDIDATMEDLQKTFYTPPFKEPSTALPALLQALIQDGRRFTSLTEVLVGQADNKAPVGTTIALIEQSMKLFTAIHKRMFAAARQEFRMLAELIHDFAPYEVYPYFLKGEQQQALQTDFDDRVDFLPVADPNIVSDVQRISMAQAVLELVNSDPMLYGPEQKVEAHKRFLQALKVPEWERLLPTLPAPTYMDPVGENAMMMVGRPVRAFPGQHHDAHMQVHQYQIQVAQNTLPPDQFEGFYANAMAHIREHAALKASEAVSQSMQQSLGAPLPPVDIYGKNEDQDPQLEMAVALLAAQHLPPVPPPQPGSVAFGQQGEQAGPDQAAEQERVTAAKNAEAQAKIERDTAGFVAKTKQTEQEHAQRMKFEEEEHRQKMRHEDQSALADILRKRAEANVSLLQKQREARVKLQHESLMGAHKLAGEVRKVRETEKAKKDAAKKKAVTKKAA